MLKNRPVVDGRPAAAASLHKLTQAAVRLWANSPQGQGAIAVEMRAYDLQ